MRLKPLLYFLAIAFSQQCVCQDIHFSNWTESPLICAPSTTGKFNGNFRILGNFRNQWRSITIPYKTVGISADAREFINALPKLQAGISFSRDITGDSRWVTTQAQCVLSYEIEMSEKISLSPLLGTGWVQQRYSNENLQYDQQWNGTYYDPSLQSGENFTQFNNNFLQFTHGISADLKGEESATSLGYSMQLNTANKNDIGYGLQRSARTTCIAIHRNNINDELSIEPSIQIQLQKSYRSILPGFKLHKTLSTGNWHSAVVNAGVRLRISDAIIPTIGMQYDQWIGGISYDINLSNLKVASTGRGGLELYIGTILKKIPAIQPTPYCRPIY
jgi:type IX secretion system PorP/SprF family membrane protein